MVRLKRPSVRLWQTELFVLVIVVAMLILSVSLSQELQRTLRRLEETERLSNVSALATQLGGDFPLTEQSRATLRDHIHQFRLIYGDGVWLYGPDGTLIDSSHGDGPFPALLERARISGFVDAPPYSDMTLAPGGFSIAGKAVYDRSGRKVASVVIASPVTRYLLVVNAVRDRLWVTFWIALTISGLLGFGFAEFIGRRVRQMSRAAAAIAGGDFDQQLPTGLVPDELYELAESYNRMALTLGQTFAALHAREREIAAVVESMGEGVVAIGPEGTIRVINPEAVLLLGLERTPAEVRGLPAGELTDVATIAGMIESGLAGATATQTVVLGERTILLNSTPIPSPDAGVGVVLLMSDVTEQKRLEETQRRFVANASHEMRTPITALKGLLELLDGGAKNDAEVRDDFLKTMQLEVDRLGRLVADLLTLAQLEAGSLTLHREPVSMPDLVREVVTVMRPLADRSKVTLATDVPAPPLDVDCDKDRIAQVLLGFTDNALKHTQSGGTVTLRATPHEDSVTLEVRDDGAGIDPQAIPHLFERFYRFDEPRTAPKGTGLGLAIAKEIVEAHGSTIEVESQPGEGASFSFELPLAR